VRLLWPWNVIDMDRAHLRETVHVQVPLGIMNDLIEYVTQRDPGWRLWNRTKKNFISDWCYLYMYKMITAEGNTLMEKKLALQPGLKETHHTIWHNVNVLHESSMSGHEQRLP
jgi:hypothetical protein